MQAGEYGITLRFNTGLDLSGATELRLMIRRPDGTEVERTDVAIEDEAAGTVTYDTIEGDIVEAGVHEFQLVADFGSTQRLYSPVHRFHITESLTVPTAES